MTDPVAHAGPDQTVAIGTTVHFDGSASTDNVGVTSYTWTFTDVNLRTLTGAAPTYQFNHAGQYIVTLTVADAAGNTNIDTVVVTVEDQTDPVANAGPDQSVNEGATVTFDGSDSTDNVGVDNLTWNFTDASVQITLYGQNPTYVFLSSGTFVVTLTVMDAAGNSDTDTVTIRVNDHPTASAGSDQTVNAGDSVVFNGSASTDDGGAVNLNYTWRINVSGTEVVKYGAIFEYTFDKAGTYTATLTVRDAGGLTSTDQVTMTVQEKAKSFVDSYWWLLVVLAVVVVALALIMLMQRGKGGKAAKKTSSDESASEDEDAGPPEKDEL
jgi:PKD repeat protein